jgi:Ca2+-binding RTX toxin-like protein
MSVVTLTEQADIQSNSQVHACIVGLAGNDEITATGVNALIVGGLGNDELTGAAGAYLRGGDGNDLLTLSTASGGTLVGNGGDDTLQTRGKAYVVPGPGRRRSLSTMSAK